MTRWKAAAIHFVISALVITTIVGLVLWLWYPLALLPMSGLDALIGIIAVVDVTAGPLLTLIVYKQGKPSLKFDLAVIAAIQVALLGYGLHTLAQVRPVFLVAVIDRFEMVAANEIEQADLDQAAAPFNRLSWTGPLRVGAEIPADPKLKAEVMDRAFTGSDIHLLPRYYLPFERVRETLLSRSKPLGPLIERTEPDERSALTFALEERLPGDTSYVPIHGARGTALMLLDSASGEPIGPAGVDPWRVEGRNLDQIGH